jgi:nucleoside 2-deoxyribosyltransferase
MDIPSVPYVALYGSHEGIWRKEAVVLLSRAGVPFFDPTDREAWSRITEETGDALQDEVDRLVKKQRDALLGASAVVFYLARSQGMSPAARFELGLLAASSIPVFLHVAPDAGGRNYVWAQAKFSPNLRPFPSLNEAVLAAIDGFKSPSTARPGKA